LFWSRGSDGEAILTVLFARFSGDELIGVVDEFADEFGRDGAIEDEGVPVALVHVVAGEDGRVFIAEFDGAVGVAFEVEACGEFAGSGEGEHFSADLEDEGIGAEGCGLFGTGHGEGVVDDVGEVHGRVEYRVSRGI